jgi:transcriptional regulator with XRE-family HTH domain
MIDNQLKKLGEELKTLRLEKGISLRKASELAGISKTSIVSIENATADYTMRSYLRYKFILD